jgi:hypothetical protein
MIGRPVKQGLIYEGTGMFYHQSTGSHLEVFANGEGWWWMGLTFKLYIKYTVFGFETEVAQLVEALHYKPEDRWFDSG